MPPQDRTPQSRTKNAVEKRLEYLASHWNRFANDPAPRMLRWMANDDDTIMLDAFFEIQSEDVLEIPDLFVRLNSPCDSSRYGQSLAEEFIQQYTADRDALMEEGEEEAEEGIDTSWQPPPKPPNDSGVDHLIACADSFRKHYSSTVPLLAIALTPSSITSIQQWITTAHALISRLPATVRVTVVDRAEAPLLDDLARASGALIRTVTPELDMPRTILQLANEDGRTGPGVEFRRRFMELAQLVPTANMPAIREKAEAAARIAQDQNWPSLLFAVNMMVAAAHSASGNADAAAAAYRTAQDTASRADVSPAKLMLQARFGEAASLLQSGAHRDAAAVYEDSVKLASETGQPLLELECWRMAGYCHQRSGEPHSAWQALWNGVAVAEALDETARKQSTLPYVGEALLNLAEQPEFVQQRMTALMGADWRDTVDAGAQPV